MTDSHQSLAAHVLLGGGHFSAEKTIKQKFCNFLTRRRYHLLTAKKLSFFISRFSLCCAFHSLNTCTFLLNYFVARYTDLERAKMFQLDNF